MWQISPDGNAHRQARADLQSKCTEVCVNNTNGLGNSMILTNWIRSKQTPSKEIFCYCITEEQSKACFMNEELREQLDCSSSTIDLTLSTVYKSNLAIE